MSWIVVLGLVVVFVVLLVLAGLTPRGGRPIANTKLMIPARVALVVFAVLVALLAWQRFAAS